MRKFLLILASLLGMVFHLPAHAQSALHFSRLSVDIWPEYDQPAVLMIYDITLAPGTTLPQDLTLKIPADSQINAVAVMNTSQSLVNAPYDDTIQGLFSVIKLTTNSTQVRIEYYLPLVRNGITRNIDFAWNGDYAVDDLEINFLRPLGAQSVSISLPPVDTAPGQDGLTNYRVHAANISAGQIFSLNIEYQRSSDALSISSQPVVAASTPGPDTPGHVSMTGIVPWVLAGIGFLLIVAGVFGFTSWRRSGPVTDNRKSRGSRKHEKEDEDIHCPQCGKRAQAGDVFCRTCGTRLA